MRLPDLLRYTLLALRRQRFRSLMLLVAVGLGVSAVVVLTALGEGARGYVLGEFAFLGKDSIILFPGRKETSGGIPPHGSCLQRHPTPVTHGGLRKSAAASMRSAATPTCAFAVAQSPADTAS